MEVGVAGGVGGDQGLTDEWRFIQTFIFLDRSFYHEDSQINTLVCWDKQIKTAWSMFVP